MKNGVMPSPPAGVQDSPAPAADVRPAEESPVRSSRLTSTGSWLILLALLGVLGMAPIFLELWDMWMDDPLRSIGMLIVLASVILTLRVWRQMGWELRGSWWGLALVLPAVGMSGLRHTFASYLHLGPLGLNLLAPKGVLYLFGSGFVLLFAGARVWRRAWFPLALLLCAQPVLHVFLMYGDLPLQDISAHMARSFAVLIGFPPTDKELLRLMFTPDFGMFIAPGCDGVRGALTMGYLALIVGYLKKVSVPRWIAYVVGGVLLGYLFNLIRLCALVLYYRIAVGHPGLQHFAKNADYIIGGCLFLVGALLFLWIVLRKDEVQDAMAAPPRATGPTARDRQLFPWRAAAFAVPALLAVVPGVHAIATFHLSFSARVHEGIITPAQLDAMLPKQIGSHTLSRAWQESANGRVVVESGAYDRGSGDEIVLGVWLLSTQHNMHVSWMARGEDPLLRGDRTFMTARGPAPFDTAFYSDGITDSIAGNAFCTPANCISPPEGSHEGVAFTLQPPDFQSVGKRTVSMFFRIDRPHTSAPQAATYQQLTTEAREFLAGVDFNDLSRRFQ
jgi:exosortase J